MQTSTQGSLSLSCGCFQIFFKTYKCVQCHVSPDTWQQNDFASDLYKIPGFFFPPCCSDSNPPETMYLNGANHRTSDYFFVLIISSGMDSLHQLIFSYLHTGQIIFSIVPPQLSQVPILLLRQVFFDLLHLVQYPCSEFRVHEGTRKMYECFSPSSQILCPPCPA